jgi:hypothetical protein
LIVAIPKNQKKIILLFTGRMVAFELFALLLSRSSGIVFLIINETMWEFKNAGLRGDRGIS